MTIADINTLARFLTRTDTTSLTAANLLIFVNKAYERIVGRIITETAGSRWQFGDLNYTAFPTFTITLTAGTQAYDFGDWTTTPLIVMGVEVLDNNGIWHIVKRTSLREIRDIEQQAQPEYRKTNGLPDEYEIRDNLIVLYPAPAAANVTLTSGLRLYYLRTADVFTSAQVTTGTKTPGFPAPWHDILAYEAAYTYASAKLLPSANFLKSEVDRKEEELLKFIFQRDQDERYRIIPSRRVFR